MQVFFGEKRYGVRGTGRYKHAAVQTWRPDGAPENVLTGLPTNMSAPRA